MKLERGGASLASITANRIFQRYGGINPVSGLPRGGAPTVSVTSQFMNLTIEAGDFVYFLTPYCPILRPERVESTTALWKWWINSPITRAAIWPINCSIRAGWDPKCCRELLRRAHRRGAGLRARNASAICFCRRKRPGHTLTALRARRCSEMADGRISSLRD